MSKEHQEKQGNQIKRRWVDADSFLRRVSQKEDEALASIPEELSDHLPHSPMRPGASLSVNLRSSKSNIGRINRTEKNYTGRF